MPDSFVVQDQLIGSTPGTKLALENVLDMRLNALKLSGLPENHEGIISSELAICSADHADWELVDNLEKKLQNEPNSKSDLIQVKILKISWLVEDDRLKEAGDLIREVESKLGLEERTSDLLKQYLLSSFYSCKYNFSRSDGEFKEAFSNCEQAFDILKKLFGEKNLIHCRALEDKAESFITLGQFKEAKSCVEESLKVKHLAFKFDPENLSLSTSYSLLGDILKEQGVLDDALENYNKSLDIKVKNLGEEHAMVADSFVEIGLMLCDQGKIKKALKEISRALEIHIEEFGEEDAIVGGTFNSMGMVLDSKKDYKAAIEYYKKSLEVYLKVYDDDHPDIASTNSNIGVSYSELGKTQEAMEYFSKSLTMRLNKLGPGHLDVAISRYNIASELWKQKEYEESLKEFRLALDIKSQILGMDDPETKELREEINKLKRKKNREGCFFTFLL